MSLVFSRRTKFKAVSLLVGFIPLSALALQLTPQRQVPIRPPAVYTARVTLPHSTHPLAKAEYDRGAVDGATPMQRLVLVLGGNVDQETSLQTLLEAQQRADSQEYHRWLTPEEFGQAFGASEPDIKTVTDWLRDQGFTVADVPQGRRWIEFSGTSALVELAFHTTMRKYQVNGLAHMANATDISIPAVFAHCIRGVLSLNDFFRIPRLNETSDHGTVSIPRPRLKFTTASNQHRLGPVDLAAIYDFSSLYTHHLDGTGQAVAIVANSDIAISDVQIFRDIFGLPPNEPRIVTNGPPPGQLAVLNPKDATGVNYQEEATADTEFVGGIAPGATITLIVSQSTTTEGVDLSSMYAVDHNVAGIISVSYIRCEHGDASDGFWNGLWQQAAAQGITVVVISGDSGAFECDTHGSAVPRAYQGFRVNARGSTAFNTAVGGTTLMDAIPATYWRGTNTSANMASAVGYIPEEVWNDSCDPQAHNSCETLTINASGGGVSLDHLKPLWQSLAIAGMPNDGHRDVPDIALTAGGVHDPYMICFAADPSGDGACRLEATSDGLIVSNYLPFGGTSAAAPLFAGIMAIVEQALGGRQGMINGTLYRLAARQYTQGAALSRCNSSNRVDPLVSSACIFNDITVGTNAVPCLEGKPNCPQGGAVGFAAGTGYDLATGLGSVNVGNLIAAWFTSGVARPRFGIVNLRRFGPE
jgi:subtilase family serine protease